MRVSDVQMGIVSLALTLVATGTARADFVSNSGIACQAFAPNVTYSNLGILNLSSAPVNMICPLGVGHTNLSFVPFSQIVLYYYDHSTTDTFRCRVFLNQTDGSVVSTPVKYTCSVAGGCPDSTSASTGFSNTFLRFQGSELSGLTGIPVDASVGLSCVVPPIAGSLPSGIISYYAQ